MPLNNPLSLSDEEVYAVSAYLLFLNGIVSEDAVMDAQSLPQVRMPNRDGFISDWPPRTKNRSKRATTRRTGAIRPGRPSVDACRGPRSEFRSPP